MIHAGGEGIFQSSCVSFFSRAIGRPYKRDGLGSTCSDHAYRGGCPAGTSGSTPAQRKSEECDWHSFYSLFSELKAEGAVGGNTASPVNKDAAERSHRVSSKLQEETLIG